MLPSSLSNLIKALHQNSSCPCPIMTHIESSGLCKLHTIFKAYRSEAPWVRVFHDIQTTNVWHSIVVEPPQVVLDNWAIVLCALHQLMTTDWQLVRHRKWMSLCGQYWYSSLSPYALLPLCFFELVTEKQNRASIVSWLQTASQLTRAQIHILREHCHMMREQMPNSGPYQISRAV